MSFSPIKFENFQTNITFTKSKEMTFEGVKLLVSDTNTQSLIDQTSQVVLPPGEAHKDWSSVDVILKKALELGLTRDSVIAGLGGGVITDMTAFAASLYMRGTKLVLIPTTLLAMVDAAFGGKTGVDYGGYKNMVGTFYPAGELVIAVDFLKTLPAEEYKSGMAEVIKTAMLGDEDLLGLLEQNYQRIQKKDLGILEEIVQRCLKVKGSFVEADLKEGGIRAHLNLGHTFGHALESLTGFSGLSHGEGVAWGIRQALQVGETLGLTDSAYRTRITKLLDLYAFDHRTNYTPQQILGAMEKDKKKKGGDLRFILQKNILETEIITIPRERLLEVWGL